MKVNKTMLLTIGACGGVALTGYFAFRAGQMVGDQNCYPPKKVWKLCIPAIVVGGATIVAIVLSNHINRKEIIALTATGTYLAMNRDELEKAIKEKYGDEALDEIKQKVNAVIAPEQVKIMAVSAEETGNGNTLCLDGYSGRIFRSSMDAVMKGIAEFNDRYQTPYFTERIPCTPMCYNDLFDCWEITETQWGYQWGWPGNEDFYTGPIEFEVTYIAKEDVAPWSDAAKFEEDIIVIELKNNYPMECWQEY